MSEADPRLPESIRVTETPDGVRYRLPLRPLGWATLCGWVVAAVGVVPLGVGGGWVGMVAMMGPPTEILVCGSLMALTLLLLGGYVAFIGCWIAFGSDEVVVTSSHVSARLRVGPLWWTIRRPRDRVSQFTLLSQTHPGSDRPLWHQLRAEGEGIKPLILAFAYPPDWLTALSHDLAWRCGADGVVPRVVEETDAAECVGDRPGRPVNCRVVLTENVDGVTLTDPPRGMWGATQAFVVVWSLGWCGFAVIFIAIFGVSLLIGGDEFAEVNSVRLVLAGVVTVVSLIGVVSLLIVVHRGRRHTVLTAADGRLTWRRGGLFGWREREWAVDDLTGLRVTNTTDSEDSNVSVHLTLQFEDGTCVDLITRAQEADYRERAELEWTATVLNRALRLPDHSGR